MKVPNFRDMSPASKITWLASIVVGVIMILIMTFQMFEDVPADKIIINQVPVSGTLQFWTNPGWKLQAFGTTTEYQKSFQIWFSKKEDQGGDADEAIKVVFNDGGNGYISGSIRILSPLDDKHLRLIHTTFGSMKNLIHELVKPTVAKVVYVTGPLMSSYESYAARKTDFIRFIEDQLRHGVYRTISREVKALDEFTNKEKVVKVAELVNDPKSPGGYQRQEEAPFERFGLQIAAVSIEDLDYDDIIKQQIASQQRAQMEVQTAIAETKKQEQQLIQAEKEGQKNATVSKWKQETENAQLIAEAEKNREIARLAKEAAEYTKQQQILLGQGESERKRLIMNADGQLQIRLDTYKEVMSNWSNAVAQYRGNWVPSTVIGSTGSGSTGYNGAQDLINLLMVKTAKDLNVSVNATK